MKRFLYLFVLAGILLLAIDGLWLYFFAADFYASEASQILRERPLLWAAALFYIIYPIGLVLCVIEPNLKLGGWLVFWKGAVFGIIAYSTYGLTNLAIIAHWSVLLSVVDILWGGLLSGIVSLAVFCIFKRFFTE